MDGLICLPYGLWLAPRTPMKKSVLTASHVATLLVMVFLSTKSEKIRHTHIYYLYISIALTHDWRDNLYKHKNDM